MYKQLIYLHDDNVNNVKVFITLNYIKLKGMVTNGINPKKMVIRKTSHASQWKQLLEVWFICL